jgi:hypothetical protein
MLDALSENSRQTEALILTKENRRYCITDRVFATRLREL